MVLDLRLAITTRKVTCILMISDLDNQIRPIYIYLLKLNSTNVELNFTVDILNIDYPLGDIFHQS